MSLALGRLRAASSLLERVGEVIETLGLLLVVGGFFAFGHGKRWDFFFVHGHPGAELFELWVVLDALVDVGEQDGVALRVVASHGGEACGKSFGDVVEGVAQAREVWPHDFEDVHGVDEAHGAVFDSFLAGILANEIEIEAIDVVPEEGRVADPFGEGL